jgi:serine/threonine protein kinase
MSFVSISCPQCSAPLPRVAIWRTVTCGFCGALITREEPLVKRETFRQALARARVEAGGGIGEIECSGVAYHLIQRLGGGERSEVYLARSAGLQPFLATIKRSTSPDAKDRYQREAWVLRELHDLPSGPAAAYALQRLPEFVSCGPVVGGSGGYALVLRHPVGYWGSLAALNGRFPDGIDPRHAVWIWRRILDVLHFIHAQGWAHGDVRPEHALVHPEEHGIRLIGWGSAVKGADAPTRAADLQRSAKVAMVLVNGNSTSIPGHVPGSLARLLGGASDDPGFCENHGARGLDALLQEAAREAFGPPAFIPLLL